MEQFDLVIRAARKYLNLTPVVIQVLFFTDSLSLNAYRPPDSRR
jgi:hypothetical protein